jgi:phosphoribosylpyrophosphate synthetase
MENLTKPILELIDAELIAEPAQDSAPVIVGKDEFAEKLATRIKDYMEMLTTQVIHGHDDYGRSYNEQEEMAENDVKEFIESTPL